MVEKRKADFYILLFFLVSFAGWLWEVGLYLVTEHEFINRGAFYGPYLPIYGAGGVLLWLMLQSFYKRKIVTFLLSTVVCSVLEYATGAFLEWKWGLRWWDYSGQFLNLNGHICLLGALGFGLGGMFLNCYIMPYYMRLYHRLGNVRRWLICAIFSIIFTVDFIWSLTQPHMGKNVTIETFFMYL